MIVLRFTIGQTTQEVRTPRSEVIVGSAPTADVTLANAGLDGHALRLVRDDTEVQLHVLGTERRITLRVGDIIEVDGLGIALVGLLPNDGTPFPVFGGYEDDHGVPETRTFELADPEPAPQPSTTQPATTQPAAAQTDTASPAQRPGRRSRRRPAAAFTVQTPAASGSPTTPPPSGGTPADVPQATFTKAVLTPEEKLAALQPPSFPDPNFATELVTQLKRTPFFAMSLGFHLLVFLIIFLFDTTSDDRPLPDGPGAVNASLDAEDEELGEVVPELEDDGLPLDQMSLPDLPELELDDEEPPKKKELPPPPSPFREELKEEDEQPEPPQMGIMPGMRAASVRLRKRRPKMPKVDLKRTFTKGGAGSANKHAAEIVRGQLGRGRKGNGATLDDLEKEDILVVSGSFDHIDRVLDALRIEYVTKSPWTIATDRAENFLSYKCIFWNCGESLRKARMRGIGARLKEFVRRGGYLFTTDWGVANVLPFAFPGYVKTNGNSAQLPEMVLTIEPARSARQHPLLEGVFQGGAKGKWWLEQASFDMTVGRKDAVTVLIECPMLRDTFNRSSAVAATFHFGRGRVLHAMGHYYQEAGNLAGTMAAHRLALNFVLMRLNQDRKPRR